MDAVVGKSLSLRNIAIKDMFNFFHKKGGEPEPLCFTTDIHCHVLPGIDDGARTVGEGADLVQSMERLGIKHIYASPHITYGTFPNTAATIAPAAEALRAELAARGCGVDIHTHAEHRIDELLTDMLEAGTIQPLPGNYLLIENSFLQEPWGLDGLVFDLQVKGFQPILAHPERYTYYYRDKERYRALHAAGLLFQVNVVSLARMNGGKNECKIAEWMIENDLVDFLGTDIHRPNYVETIEKYLTTSAARDHASALRSRILNDKVFG